MVYLALPNQMLYRHPINCEIYLHVSNLCIYLPYQTNNGWNIYIKFSILIIKEYVSQAIFLWLPLVYLLWRNEVTSENPFVRPSVNISRFTGNKLACLCRILTIILLMKNTVMIHFTELHIALLLTYYRQFVSINVWTET